MNSHLRLSGGSLLLVSLPAIWSWLALGVLAAAFHYTLLAGILLFLFLLGGAARLWGARAMRGLCLQAECDREQLFAGQTAHIRYTIKNEKLLPLIWLELSLDVPFRDCLRPDDTFTRVSFPPPPSDAAPVLPDIYRRTFSFVMGMETLCLDSVWTAERRGLYRSEHLRLRSGDGFGLSQADSDHDPALLPAIAVYPRPVAVDVGFLLRNQWDTATGAAGFLEDMSVLRGMRPYQYGDSWKRINWRIAARQQQELQVNSYEMIQPRTALFVLDGESYCGLSADFSELEDTLEVLAAAITGLSARSVCCGLCLPASRCFPATTLPPAEERTAAELLYYLAGYDCLADNNPGPEGEPNGSIAGSRFDTEGAALAAAAAGSIFLFTHAPDRLAQTLLSMLERSRVTVFSSGVTEQPDPELTVYPLSRLKKGECR